MRQEASPFGGAFCRLVDLCRADARRMMAMG